MMFQALRVFGEARVTFTVPLAMSALQVAAWACASGWLAMMRRKKRGRAIVPNVQTKLLEDGAIAVLSAGQSSEASGPSSEGSEREAVFSCERGLEREEIGPSHRNLRGRF